jgi:predicted ATP-dependent endonuclease of OLD family
LNWRLYLHPKAQQDMIAVFNELSETDQIIYSTHSSSLINPRKLHRIRLVYNTKDCGTTIEKITSLKTSDSKDALKPIIDAIGIDVSSNFSFVQKNNVIVEGISDFYYFQSFKSLLNIEDNFAFIPSMGATNVHLLMELCMGWGLNWVIVFDEKGSKRELSKIRKAFFPQDGIENKIFTIRGCDGIEDVLSESDFKLVRNDVSFPATSKNSETINQYGGKELYSRLFAEMVVEKKILAKNVSKNALDRFREIFDFIQKNLDRA